MSVLLSWPEVIFGAHVGILRRVSSLKAGQVERFNNPPLEEAWDRAINGALGEMAFAKAEGLYWGGHVDTFRTPDVGRYEVKHTLRPDGCLIVQRDADPATVYVLVTGSPPTLEIRGKILAGEAQRSEWWRGDVRHPAFFVPQPALAQGGARAPF